MIKSLTSGNLLKGSKVIVEPFNVCRNVEHASLGRSLISMAQAPHFRTIQLHSQLMGVTIFPELSFKGVLLSIPLEHWQQSCFCFRQTQIPANNCLISDSPAAWFLFYIPSESPPFWNRYKGNLYLLSIKSGYRCFKVIIVIALRIILPPVCTTAFFSCKSTL